MNKNIYITPIFFFSFLCYGYSQPIMFERNYSDSNAVEAASLQQTFDGGYILAGRRSFPCFFCNDAILMKTDSLGNIQWLKVYGTTLSDDNFYDVKQTPDSGFVACGGYPVMGMGTNMYVVKTDKNGDTIWTKNYGGNNWESAFSIEQTFDGGYIVAGIWDSTGVLLKLDANGDTLWKKHFHDYTGIALYSVAQIPDSGFVATGVLATGVPGYLHQLYLIRTDKNGDTIWTRSYGYSGAEFGQSVKLISDGNIVVCGYTQSFDFGDLYLLKLNMNGDTLWSKILIKPDANTGNSIEETPDNGFIIGGITRPSSSDPENAWLVRTDSSGNVEWEKSFGGVSDDYGYKAITTDDGGFAICGMTNSFIPSAELYFVKTDANGSIVGINDPVFPETGAIKVWPNPFSSEISIDISNLPVKDIFLLLYDAKGSLILSHTENNPAEIITLNLNNPLEPGFYFLRITNRNDINQTFKLIKY